MRLSLMALAGAFITALLLLAKAVDQPDELDQEQALYCEMVAIHKSTGGEYGWPDYKGVYAEACR